MNELCLANLTVGDAGPLELIDAAAAGGFASVNMWLVEPPAMAFVAGVRRDVPTVVGDKVLIDAIRRRADAHGVSIFTASAGWIGPGFAPSSIAPVIETLVALRARSISVVGWDSDRARLTEHLAAVCGAAAEHGLDVHMEFMAYSAVKTVGDARDVLAAAGQPNARIIVDALHLDRAGGTPADVRALDAGTIASVQLCDAPAAHPPPEALRDESVNGRLLPGDGALPLIELMDALPAGVVVELETPVAALRPLSITERARRCGDAARRFLRRR